jgi:hypothetical protein
VKKSLILIFIMLFPPSSYSFELFEGWDRTDKVLFAIDAISIAADMYTTERALDEPWAYEKNALLGRHPSDAKLVAFGVCSLALDYVIADRLDPSWRKGYLAFVSAWSFKCARGNYIRIEMNVGF